MRTWIGLVLLLGVVANAQAVPDHLQCFKVTNATLKKLKGVVDLDAPSVGVAPGCRLSSARLYCVPATQTVRPDTVSDGPVPVTRLPYHGPAAETDRVCYRVTCDGTAGTAPDQTVTDEFGRHEFRRATTEMVCAPATGGTLPPPATGFQIKSPPIDVVPGQDVTYCYYFRTPNTVTIPVKKFVSEMGPANERFTFLLTNTQTGGTMEKEPPGTVSIVDCTFPPSALATNSQWMYEAHAPNAELAMPADDGAGHPVAMEIPPNSSGYLIMHHVNMTNAVVQSRVTLNVEALDSPVYTKAATYSTYEYFIEIPANTRGYTRSRACTVPTGAKFWRFTTHGHKQAARAAIQDGTSTVFESLDWANPGARTVPPPFYTFAQSTLGPTCTWNNPTNRTIYDGISFQSEEECITVGYFFPATRSIWCLNGLEY